jgi:putative oxygen-independent coproporphyrinogen III oxidase
VSPPLGVYIHWPYCARICPYCDFNVYRARGRATEQAALVEAIAADLTAHRTVTGDATLVSIFFGGGTPSLMDPADVARLIALARSLWTPAARVEISLEANPTDAEAQHFAALAEAGVNRLSLGVQSLDDGALRLLGRNHGADEAARAARLARRLFEQLSIDLIYALPDQTPQDWHAALEAALALDPDHVSPYQLTIEAGTAFERAVRRGTLVPPDDVRGADLYDATQTVLSAHGYSAYEVSNHARGPEAMARHNLVYWRGEAYVGVGPGAHGRLRDATGWLATEAARTPADYAETVARQGLGHAERDLLTPEARAEERLLMGLRIADGVRWDEIAALGLSPGSPRIADLQAHGLLRADAERLQATPEGRRLLDSIIRTLIV